MKKSFLRSKALRLSLIFSGLIATLILVFVLLFAFVIRQNDRKRQSNFLSHTAESARKIIENVGPDMVTESDFMEIPYFVSVCIYEDDGGRTVYSNDPFIRNLPKAEEKAINYIEKNYFIDGDLNVLYRTLSFDFSGKNYVVQVSVNMERDFATRLLKELNFAIMLFSLPLILVSFLASYFIIKSTISPVKKMTETAKKMSYASENHFEIAGSGDEFDRLAETFNTLFSRLKQDFEREKQFTSDVSHELKTPIAVIAGHANLIRRWGKDDPVQLEKSIGRLTAEVHTMQAIVDNLLQISRLERGAIKLEKKSVSIMDLSLRLKEDTEAWAENATVTVTDMGTDTIFCDAELLYESMTIIVSNSVKYAKPNKVNIIIEEKVTDRGAELRIVDDGPGIKKEALPHVLERFYRADESHNRDKEKGGSGLGLAIVKSIMDIHGGQVQIFSDGIKGTTVTLTFPKKEGDR
ncbi:HAMP domain-containing sensor histidine kinase [Treponema sp.]|uniref:HAMP domain-containing sensor histidine kinase n=1 Tax=Treponema sp. TaxID=166 RepID=UPI00298D965F|nr:HAMP domain-containing sensor histidine kinase [Treponema sp.]MCQ2241767.1 HAMP domain-containing histidine kinase [Treponema sp.]